MGYLMRLHLKSTFLKFNSANYTHSSRTLWAWLNSIFNKYDPSRVEEVGPDIACAEWLLRCGAQVKWKNSDRWHSDYNTLPRDRQRQKIEEIDASESAVMNIGFLHLKDLRHLKKIRFHKCSYLDNAALTYLRHVKVSLEDLHISSCGNVTDEGIMNVLDLIQLKNLHLYDLPGVKDRLGCLELLLKAMPHCKITFPEIKN